MVSPNNLEFLPWEERLKRYRQMSEAAFRDAANAGTKEERDQFLALGNGWYELAAETERLLRERR